MNEMLASAKVKLWSACKLGDTDQLLSVIDHLLMQAQQNCAKLEEQDKGEATIDPGSIINKDDVTKLVNDPNEDGNTMLHLAALGGHLKVVWYVDCVLM